LSILFPIGTKPDETRYHKTPFTRASVNKDGRVVYEWIVENGSPSKGYTFGASFPKKYVKEVIKVSAFEKVLKSFGALIGSFLKFFLQIFPVVL